LEIHILRVIILEKKIQTENGLDEFQVRLIRADGVGLLTNRKNKSYLILDSLDYWYDLIQEQYPAKIKCSCKNDWFKLSFQYEYRENSPDISNVQIKTVCTNCGKLTPRMTVDIDYSPTNKLTENPVTYCEKPLIKYKYHDFSGIWLPDELNKVLRFLLEGQGWIANYYYFRRSENLRVFHALTLKQALEKGSDFLGVYFTLNAIENAVVFEDTMGVVVDSNIWRKQELVYMTCYIVDGLPMYHIRYCNQYIDQGEVKDKSAEFEAMTHQMKAWFSETFVKTRGRNCFDSEEGYKRFKEQLKF
jgi:hypothetical protein